MRRLVRGPVPPSELSEIRMHILLVEDDIMLANAICSGLQQQAWQTTWVGDAAAARIALIEHDYAAVLLDVGLPGESGLSALAALRANHDPTPVLMVTARDQLSDRIRGLDAGADDYIVKPFHPGELYARLRAVIRRAQGRATPVFIFRDITLDPNRRTVSKEGQPVALSVHEYRTLLMLMERPGKAVAREQIEHVIYGESMAIESNTVAVYIHQLRRKLGAGLITTVHGFGYRIGQG